MKAPKTKPDPLIDEVRAIRKDLSDRHQNDVRKLAEHVRQVERELEAQRQTARPSELRSG